MIGDRLMIYNPANDMFYQGRDKYRRVIAGQPAPAKWTPKPELAKCSNALIWYTKLCDELGGGVRIVSETEALRIVRMRKYREARDVQQRTAQAESTVLSFTGSLSSMRGQQPGTKGPGIVR